MGSLVSAYVLGWLATTVYVAWLAVQSARLATRQKELQEPWQQRECAAPSCSKAA